MSSEEHKTTDLALASALIVAGGTIGKISSIGYTQVEFTIHGKNVSEILMKFQNRKLEVDAMTLFETYKSLKARANDVLRNTY